MTRSVAFITVIIVLGLSLSFHAYAEAFSLRCNFTYYVGPKGVLKKYKDDFVLEYSYDSITSEAFLKGDNGVSKVFAIGGSAAMTFLETLGSGVVQTTTVVIETGKAVHSRHTVLLPSDLIPSQHYGTCASS